MIPQTVEFENVSYRVTSIGTEVFCRCELLTDIRFQGAIAQWEKIELGNAWNDEVPATVVRCADGDVKI